MAILALSGGDRYVAAAYLVFLFLVLSYLAIMAVKLSRIEREVVAIAEAVEGRDRAAGEAAPPRAREPVG
ncbi:MAG: hypothetical protein QOJ35_1713 [Solirubrobacteraceae bacterium]|jgi:hypothetical protein|nr:hypothetical protein [Solirubrobacteraceae bacterium]